MRIRPGPRRVRQWGLSAGEEAVVEDSTILQVLRRQTVKRGLAVATIPQDKVTRLEEGRRERSWY